MARGIKEILPDKENVKLGHPSKLSSLDRRTIVSSITTRKQTMLFKPPISSILSFSHLSLFELVIVFLWLHL